MKIKNLTNIYQKRSREFSKHILLGTVTFQRDGYFSKLQAHMSQSISSLRLKHESQVTSSNSTLELPRDVRACYQNMRTCGNFLELYCHSHNN
jgi:hypothetical protein